MKLIHFKEVSRVIAKDQPQYNPMPAHVSPEGRVTCCWELTWRERLSVLFSGKLWHQILAYGWPVQPQLLLTEKPDIS